LAVNIKRSLRRKRLSENWVNCPIRESELASDRETSAGKAGGNPQPSLAGPNCLEGSETRTEIMSLERPTPNV